MRKTVAHFMGEKPIIIPNEAPIQDFLEAMSDGKVTHALITDDEEKVIGIVSRKDVLDYLLELLKEGTGKVASGLQLKHTNIKSIMTPTPITVEEEDDMEYAISLFQKYKFHCLPVVNDLQQPIGVISFFDILVGLWDELHEPATGFKFEHHLQSGQWMFNH